VSLAVSLTRCIVSRAVSFTVSVACDTRLPGESRWVISSIVSLMSARFCSISARISAVSGVVSVLPDVSGLSRAVDITSASAPVVVVDPYGYALVAGVSGSAPVMPRPTMSGSPRPTMSSFRGASKRPASSLRSFGPSPMPHSPSMFRWFP
jgi:hypothetical protein